MYHVSKYVNRGLGSWFLFNFLIGDNLLVWAIFLYREIFLYVQFKRLHKLSTSTKIQTLCAKEIVSWMLRMNRALAEDLSSGLGTPVRSLTGFCVSRSR